MITNFKLFESWDDKIGSYVILKKDFLNKKYSEFLLNNIGIITKVYYPGGWFDVKFENAPEDITRLLMNINFHNDEIEHISKNKQDLESILSAKKYNL